MVNFKKKKTGIEAIENIRKNAPKMVEHTEDVVKDFIEDLMSKDWKKLLESEIGKIKGNKNSKNAATGISLVAAFAIGYMLGSLRRQ